MIWLRKIVASLHTCPILENGETQARSNWCKKRRLCTNVRLSRRKSYGSFCRKTGQGYDIRGIAIRSNVLYLTVLELYQPAGGHWIDVHNTCLRKMSNAFPRKTILGDLNISYLQWKWADTKCKHMANFETTYQTLTVQRHAVKYANCTLMTPKMIEKALSDGYILIT